MHSTRLQRDISMRTNRKIFRWLLPGAALALIFGLASCGPGNLTLLSDPTPSSAPSSTPVAAQESGTYQPLTPEDPEEAAALAEARKVVEDSPKGNQPEIVREFGCVETTSAKHDAQPNLVTPVEGDPDQLIWACDFEVILMRPVPPPLFFGGSPAPWPAEGKPGFVRVVLLQSGARIYNFKPEEFAPLGPA
jgi:hypothetical protein